MLYGTGGCSHVSARAMISLRVIGGPALRMAARLASTPCGRYPSPADPAALAGAADSTSAATTNVDTATRVRNLRRFMALPSLSGDALRVADNVRSDVRRWQADPAPEPDIGRIRPPPDVRP